MSKEQNLIELFEQKVNLSKGMSNDELIQKLQRFISNYQQHTRPPRPAQDLYSVMEEVVETLSKGNSEYKAIPTGFQNYDINNGGLIPGELFLIGGRPSMGKTQLLVQLAINTSVHVPVLFCTLDNTKDLLAQRFISNKADISGGDLLLYRLRAHEKTLVKNAITSMQERTIIISDENNSSIDQLLKHWEVILQERQIKVMFIDYIQLLGGALQSKYRHQELSYISQRLKKFAQQHKIALIVASQLSRNVEARGGCRIPNLSDLSESGALEQDADKVAFIYRPEYYGLTEDEFGPTENIVHLVIAKNRSGKTDTLLFKKTPNFNRIHELYEANMNFREGSRFSEFDNDIDPF
jgi:replicative DNA helicase